MNQKQPTSETLAKIVSRILEVHIALVSIAHELRRMDDFDHAQDMSDAALHCRAAYNELRFELPQEGPSL